MSGEGKRVNIPGVLVDKCNPYLEKEGYGSISELVRDKLREFAREMEQKKIQEITGEKMVQARKAETKLFGKVRELIEDEDYEKAEEILNQIYGDKD